MCFVVKNSVVLTIHSWPQKSQEGTKRNSIPHPFSHETHELHERNPILFNHEVRKATRNKTELLFNSFSGLCPFALFAVNGDRSVLVIISVHQWLNRIESAFRVISCFSWAKMDSFGFTLNSPLQPHLPQVVFVVKNPPQQSIDTARAICVFYKSLQLISPIRRPRGSGFASFHHHDVPP